MSKETNKKTLLIVVLSMLAVFIANFSILLFIDFLSEKTNINLIDYRYPIMGLFSGLISAIIASISSKTLIKSSPELRKIAQINENDERLKFIRYKSFAFSFYVALILFLIMIFIFIMLNLLIPTIVVTVACLIYTAFWMISLIYYNKKI